MSRKWLFFMLVVAAGVALDQWSKQWALSALHYAQTQEAWGGFLKLTLSFNKGAAFGLHLGSASRVIFIVFVLLTLSWLIVVYHRTAKSRLRLLGLTFVCAGALGNLVDRITSDAGVVDFLGPYDLGFMLWPIFNVADIWVVLGIAALFLSMSHEGTAVTLTNVKQVPLGTTREEQAP
jgi:signal peptidase II